MTPRFPTSLHQDAAECVRDYFSVLSNVDTVLVVNSCARGQAVPESDLDFAILVKPETSLGEKTTIESDWQTYAETQPALLKYKQSNPFAKLHLDIVDGNYVPNTIEEGAAPDSFELEVGNQIRYSAPMGEPGSYFLKLENKWLPYYEEGLRLQRLRTAHEACEYDLEHVPFYVRRGLYFQAFDTLYRAFQIYLQTLFIANRTYPIAYNKWIKEQVVKWLGKPELYPPLAPILSVSDLESEQVNDKASMLRELLGEIGD